MKDIYKTRAQREDDRFLLRYVEKEDASQLLEEILTLALPLVPEYFGQRVITKAPGYAVERIEALKKLGFTPSEQLLVGEGGETYNGYWVKEYDRASL